MQTNEVMEEINNLNRLDHPNIVKYFECYDDVKQIYLIMEYISGCKLSDKLNQHIYQHQNFAQHENYDEKKAASYLEKIF